MAQQLRAVVTCSSTEPKLKSQHPSNSLQQATTSVPGDPIPSSKATRSAQEAQTHMQAKHPYAQKTVNFEEA